jgi:hypothetical protein
MSQANIERGRLGSIELILNKNPNLLKRLIMMVRFQCILLAMITKVLLLLHTRLNSTAVLWDILIKTVTALSITRVIEETSMS